MRKGVFRNGNHLQDIRLEDVLDFLQVDFGKIFAGILLGGVVDKYIEGPESVRRLIPFLACSE